MSVQIGEASVDRRRDPRTLCSVLSDVYVTSSKGHQRFLTRAIVTDISSSGLALVMDDPPYELEKLTVRNGYFHVEVNVRNMVPLSCGFRVGCEFANVLKWQPERAKALR